MLPIPLITSRVRNLIARKLRWPNVINAKTCKAETIYPEAYVSFDEPLYLDGQIEKIKGAPFGQTVDDGLHAVAGKDRYCGPVLRLELTNASVTSKYVYSGQMRNPFNHKIEDRLPASMTRVDQAVLKSSTMGCGYFGHWLRDDCATHLMADTDHDTQLVMGTPHWSDKADYAARFDQDWSPTAPHFCKEMSMYFDIGQNPHKAERFRTLRSRIRAKTSVTGADIVYLKRGPQSSPDRELTNEDAVIDMLEGMGAKVFEAESGIDTLEQVALDARIMIGVEGSQLSHALYMLRDAGGLLVLQPPYRFFTSHLDWARAMEMPFAFMVGDPDGAGFAMDLDDLQRTIELLDTKLG